MLLITASAVTFDGDINVRHPSQLHISSPWLTPSFLSLGWRSQRPSLSSTQGWLRPPGASPGTWGILPAPLEVLLPEPELITGQLPCTSQPWATRSCSLWTSTAKSKPRSPVQPKHIAWDGPHLDHLPSTKLPEGSHVLHYRWPPARPPSPLLPFPLLGYQVGSASLATGPLPPPLSHLVTRGILPSSPCFPVPSPFLGSVSCSSPFLSTISQLCPAPFPALWTLLLIGFNFLFVFYFLKSSLLFCLMLC